MSRSEASVKQTKVAWKDPWSTGLSQQRVLFTNEELRFSKWEAVLSNDVSSVQVAVWQ